MHLYVYICIGRCPQAVTIDSTTSASVVSV